MLAERVRLTGKGGFKQNPPALAADCIGAKQAVNPILQPSLVVAVNAGQHDASSP